MPFRDPAAGDLATRISAEIRHRLEEALDSACLDTLVRARRTRGLPPPEAENQRDREEYAEHVRQLLERLHAHFASSPPEEVRAAIRGAATTATDPVARLMTVQVELARLVPDYWQRFDAVRLDYAAERAASGGEGRGLLRRLFSRG